MPLMITKNHLILSDRVRGDAPAARAWPFRRVLDGPATAGPRALRA